MPILRPKKGCQTQYSTLKAQITYNGHIILFNVFMYFLLYYTLPFNAHKLLLRHHQSLKYEFIVLNNDIFIPGERNKIVQKSLMGK